MHACLSPLSNLTVYHSETSELDCFVNTQTELTNDIVGHNRINDILPRYG